jgi:hypothetical protein
LSPLWPPPAPDFNVGIFAAALENGPTLKPGTGVAPTLKSGGGGGARSDEIACPPPFDVKKTEPILWTPARGPGMGPKMCIFARN